jgi:hypothetical protein
MQTISKPALWGVGTYRAGSDLVPYALSYEDVQRDIRGAVAALRSLGVERGSPVLIVSMLSEAAQYWPVVCATIALGARLSCADASRFDAFRVAMFLRGTRYRAVVGINEDVLDGLADLDVDPIQLFQDAGLVGARASAYKRIRDAGVHTARRWLHAGPALAVECSAGAVHADGGEWRLTERDGDILITSTAERATVVRDLPTSIRGRIGNAPCPCGRADPAILFPKGATP